ncbi:hypothetical protein MVEN_02146700 [Mycena venus]|uniref:MYND-type domain-containing protein n=1 Tax=Mycena venus TaxID=2733690 RepID=A0A8H6XAB1_9AGAR|nr:hypothetical protein MVEN_02146700 [Mycena venus]
MSCSYCRVSKYCSDKCQKYEWSSGSRHKERCHLFEIDRKLSDLYIQRKVSNEWTRFSGLGVCDPALNLAEVSQWRILHFRSVALILSAAYENHEELKENTHLGIFLKLVGDGHDHCSFIIDKVAFIPWSPNESWATVKMGFCLLPDGKITSLTREGQYGTYGTTLPPGFDLHRYITHVNRGITHFHGSFWPLPRKLSDTAFDAAKPPKEWLHYMRHHPGGFIYVDGIESEVFGVAKRDGSQVQLYEYDKRVSQVPFDFRLKEMAKINTTEFKKLLDDSTRRVCMIHKKEEDQQNPASAQGEMK